jgi:Tol biopolymer transport system component
MKIIILLFIALSTSHISFAQSAHLFGQKISDTVTLFAPGIISDEFSNRDMTISPDGNELYYTIQHSNGALSFIMHMKKENNKWSKAEVAVFSGKYNDLEPAFSPNGNQLFFSSNRPLNGKGDSIKDYDLWCIHKVSGKWGVPVNLGSIVNSSKDEFYPSVSKNGTIYFTRDMGKAKEDIVFAQYRNGQYDSARSLPSQINTDGFEFNAFVSPDEDYIIFSGYNRPDGFGSADLYLSIRDEKGEWNVARNLGNKINSSFLDYCPFVSFDKKYFFFTSKRNRIKSPMKSPLNFKQLKNLLQNPQNGSDDIYCIDFNTIKM